MLPPCNGIHQIHRQDQRQAVSLHTCTQTFGDTAEMYHSFSLLIRRGDAIQPCTSCLPQYACCIGSTRWQDLLRRSMSAKPVEQHISCIDGHWSLVIPEMVEVVQGPECSVQESLIIRLQYINMFMQHHSAKCKLSIQSSLNILAVPCPTCMCAILLGSQSHRPTLPYPDLHRSAKSHHH